MPAVTVCAALIVRLPLAPISSVWLALVIAIAAAAVAVLANFRVEADPVAIANAGPLVTVPDRIECASARRDRAAHRPQCSPPPCRSRSTSRRCRWSGRTRRSACRRSAGSCRW